MKDIFGWLCVAVIGVITLLVVDLRFFPLAKHPPWEYEALWVLVAVAIVANAVLAWRNKKRRRPNGSWN
jgi:hypothetical protein